MTPDLYSHEMTMTEPTTDWSRKYAAWSQLGPADARRTLLRLLKADRLIPISDVDIKTSISNWDPTEPPVYLAEVRALDLRTPNPFPLIPNLWPTSRR